MTRPLPGTMDVPDSKIIELRQLFLDKLEREGGKIPGGLHPSDIDRIKNRKKWLRLFLEYNDLNTKSSLEQLWNTCIWRKDKSLNDRDNERTVNMDIMKAGLMFDHNKDRDGKRLLVFNTRLYTRGSYNVDEMKKNLNYYIERMYRETDMDQITCVFDMQNTGMSNMDLDYTRYIINLFKHHYPMALNYILVYELPWVLTATFKIIKGLLPPKAVEALKFVNKKNISEYVSPENMLACWGGADNYQFEFTPQDPNVQIQPRDAEDMGDGNNNVSQISNKNSNGAIGRKVHFAPNMSPIDSPMSEQPASQFKDDKRLKVLDEGILFGPDAQGNVTVKNVSTETVMFKVKTTSPEKFRVSPPAGLIRPGQAERITVSMVHGHQHEEATVRDKFLIMCKPLEEGVNEEFVPIDQIHKEFKQANTNSIEQHRVRCIYSINAEVDASFQANEGEQQRVAFRGGVSTMKFSTGADDRTMSRNSGQMIELHETVQKLERQVSRIQTMQFVMLAILVLLIALIAIYMPKSDAEGDTLGETGPSRGHSLPGKGM